MPPANIIEWVASSGKFCEKTRLMNKMDIAIDSIVIGLSVALLWHFSNIWRYGQHLITEPSITILTMETGFFLLTLTFGVLKCMRDAKKRKR